MNVLWISLRLTVFFRIYFCMLCQDHCRKYKKIKNQLIWKAQYSCSCLFNCFPLYKWTLMLFNMFTPKYNIFFCWRKQIWIESFHSICHWWFKEWSVEKNNFRHNTYSLFLRIIRNCKITEWSLIEVQRSTEDMLTVTSQWLLFPI